MHLIDHILATDGLTVLFQPVVELEGETLRLHTLECLTRGPQGSNAARDDVGLGHSNYGMMLDTQPEYLKIDRYFVHGAFGDLHRRAVLDSIAQLGLKLGARVVG